MKSKTLCNILIILFILVSIVVSVFSAIFKNDWKAVVFPLALGCVVLLMYQAVIYKGKRDSQLINQLPIDEITKAIKEFKGGNAVNVSSSNTI